MLLSQALWQLSLSLSRSPTSRWPLKVHVNFISQLRSADVSTTHRFLGVRNTETDKDATVKVFGYYGSATVY